MGTAKQLLDVGGRPMLLAVLEPLAAADVAGTAVVSRREILDALPDDVTVPCDAQGGPSLQRWGHESHRLLFAVLNEDPATEMIDSIRLGIAAWRRQAAIGEQDGFLICPGDQPGITTADINRCIRAFREQPDRIIIATREDRRGHPIIFPSSLAAFVESEACDAGLNALPRQNADRVVAVSCASAAITRDIDTPGDYADT